LFGAARRTETSAVDMYRSIAASKREEKMQEPQDAKIGRIYFPSSPASSSRYSLISTAPDWRACRMAGPHDRTTNWALTLVAAMLSSRFPTSNAHHSVLMFAMVLAFFLLMIESRRYRLLRTSIARACAGWSAITTPNCSIPV